MQLTRIPGIGPKTAASLRAAGFAAVHDLLRLVPTRYIDRRQIVTIDRLVEGGPFHVVAVVRKATSTRGWGRRGAFGRVTFEDATGSIDAFFFGAPAKGLANAFRVGRRVFVSGEVRRRKDEWAFSHPDTFFLDDDAPAPARYFPVYSAVESFGSKRLGGWIRSAVDLSAPRLIDALPRAEIGWEALPTLVDALREIHAPPDEFDAAALAERRTPGYERMILDELFFLQIGLQLRRRDASASSAQVVRAPVEALDRFIRSFGFSWTADQARCVSEILGDMAAGRPMHRLLQGDVGSGKTAVAMAAAAAIGLAGAQAAVMAPTEVLARQHVENWRGRFADVGLRLAFLGGGLERAEARRVREDIASGVIDVAVGTHALVSDGSVFRNLALIVVDEQHRFGVVQRGKLSAKSAVPHVLVMSATPIPRTLSMTVYGDLDVSILREKPPGRRPILTRVWDGDRTEVYARVRAAVEAGERAFVIHPLVEDSEEVDWSSAVTFYEKEAVEFFPGIAVGLLHGRLRPEEKAAALRRFANGETPVLVATTVVEVGVDVPEAGVVVIEDAQRFGLSQLHQIRGRVGRSERAGECWLLTDPEIGDRARRRLAALGETDDGFAIAEEDLAIRGPGDILGSRQHGIPSLRWAHWSRDVALFLKARDAASTWLDAHPDWREHRDVVRVLAHRWGDKLDLENIG